MLSGVTVAYMDVGEGRELGAEASPAGQKNAPRQLLLGNCSCIALLSDILVTMRCSTSCIPAVVHFLHFHHDVHGCTNAAMTGCH